MKTLCSFTILIMVFIGLTTSVPAQKFHSGHAGHGETSSTKLNYDSLFADAVPLDKSPEGQALIENCLNKYNETENLDNLNSFQLNYRMQPMMSGDSIDVSRCFQRNQKYKISKTGPSRSESRIFNGEQSWFVNSDTVMVIDSGRYKAEYFSYLTLTMPLGIKTEKFNKIRFGTRTDDPLSYIYMEKTDTLMIIIGIDPQDNFVKSSEGIINQGDKKYIFINRFDDFRKVDGYYFPFQLTNISMGLEVGNSRLIDVIVNKKFDDNDFLPESRNKRKTY